MVRLFALVSCGGKMKFINRMKGSTVLFLRVIKVNVRWEILLRLVSFGNNARRRIPPVFIPPY